MPERKSRLNTRRPLNLTRILIVAISLLLTMPTTQAASGPVCPGDAHDVYPVPGKVNEAPVAAAWEGLKTLPENCQILLQSPAALTIALSGQFSHAGPIEEIASRLGDISKTRNLVYWSVTDGDWRLLVSDAFALDTFDVDSVRSDFTAQEILSGQTRYFAQNDTRSWGLNVYSLRVLESSAEHLMISSANMSAIRLGPVTLFDPDDVYSLLFIQRENETTWLYFSVSVIRHSALAAREKSLINRQAAFYRLLIGQPPDQEPPLAP